MAPVFELELRSIWRKSAIFAGTTIVCLLVIATAADAQATFAKEHLKTLCMSYASEPVCVDQNDLNEDEAWVIVRAACRISAIELCKQFRSEQGAVLTFDTHDKSWSAQWEQRRVELDFDVAGIPTLRLRPQDARPLKIVVTNISPLTYSAKAGTPKEEDVAVIAGLKNVLALAGTGVQALIQSASYVAAPNVLGGLPTIVDGRSNAPIRPNADLPPPPACTIPVPDIAVVGPLVSERNKSLVELAEQMRGVEEQLDVVTQRRIGFVRAIQSAEDGLTVTAKDLALVSLTDVETAYRGLAGAAGVLRKRTDLLASCQPTMAAYLSVIGGPNDIKVLSELARQVDATQNICKVPELARALKSNADALVSCKAVEPTVLAESLKLHNAVMKPVVERLLNARQSEEKIWQAIDKLEAGKEELLFTVGTLNREVTDGLKHTWRGELIREISVTRPNPKLGWAKIQSHSIVIKADSPYTKSVSLKLNSEEKVEYKLESSVGRILGYGIGVVYTPLYESTWTAVSVPGTSTKVIAETKRETRAGDLAAFLTYRFMEHPAVKSPIKPILEFGAAITTTEPAFFLGTGIELFHAARVGIGWAPQRVTVLSAGQHENETVVSGNDDIRTEKRFDTSNWYASFTFALDSLTLFK